MQKEKNDLVHTRPLATPADWPLARTLALALALSCAACSNSPALTPLTAREVAESGTAAFDAPRRTVLDACALALRKQGYAIDVADPATGLVVTLRSPSSLRSPSGARLFRAHVLEVKEPRSGRVAEEHAAWTRLFEDVRGIVERASP